MKSDHTLKFKGLIVGSKVIFYLLYEIPCIGAQGGGRTLEALDSLNCVVDRNKELEDWVLHHCIEGRDSRGVEVGDRYTGGGGGRGGG